MEMLFMYFNLNVKQVRSSGFLIYFIYFEGKSFFDLKNSSYVCAHVQHQTRMKILNHVFFYGFTACYFLVEFESFLDVRSILFIMTTGLMFKGRNALTKINLSFLSQLEKRQEDEGDANNGVKTQQAESFTKRVSYQKFIIFTSETFKQHTNIGT